MTTIKQYFEYSQLAQAAYALWNEGVSTTVLVDQSGFALSQAREFLGVDTNGIRIPGKGYSVLNHAPNDPTGFSATVFMNNETGKMTIAFRGTETDGFLNPDVLEDGFLAVEGYARDQIYSLYNYIQRLITPPNETVAQWVRAETFDPAGDVIITWALTGTAHGLGVIPEGAQIDVTGHSLGGHLAMAASRLFPSLWKLSPGRMPCQFNIGSAQKKKGDQEKFKCVVSASVMQTIAAQTHYSQEEYKDTLLAPQSPNRH